MILVLADDFSGAAEMAGMAHRHGLHTRVCTRSMHFSSADLVAIDTQTRTAGPEQAAKGVHQILLQMRSPDIRWVFKKVDSVLRGFVREELESLCAAQGLERALLLPANPSKQRTLRKGQYWLADQPLHQTHFVSDPHFPRLTSQVEGLLAQQGKLPIRVINHITELGSRGIFIPNIERLDQVRLWANEAPADCLLSGGVDFFAPCSMPKVTPKKQMCPQAMTAGRSAPDFLSAAAQGPLRQDGWHGAKKKQSQYTSVTQPGLPMSPLPSPKPG